MYNTQLEELFDQADALLIKVSGGITRNSRRYKGGTLQADVFVVTTSGSTKFLLVVGKLAADNRHVVSTLRIFKPGLKTSIDALASITLERRICTFKEGRPKLELVLLQSSVGEAVLSLELEGWEYDKELLQAMISIVNPREHFHSQPSAAFTNAKIAAEAMVQFSEGHASAMYDCYLSGAGYFFVRVKWPELNMIFVAWLSEHFDGSYVYHSH